MMRDIKRIDRILEILRCVWNQVPDWRLGQIIENIKLQYNIDDLFYIEDDEFENYIRDYFQIDESKTPI